MKGTLTVGQASEEGKKKNRQASILQLMEQSFYASVEEIAERFSVTAQTARRDILALEEAGKVRRLHGGAVITGPLESTVYHRRRVDNAAQKERIGELAAGLVPDGISVFIDSGTTCEAIAHAFANHSHLRAVTYSLRVAAILNEKPNITLAVPGGFVRPVHGGIFQEDMPEFMQRFKFDSAIISVSGIDTDGDICDDDHAEGAIATLAMAQANRTILTVDSSKFGRRAMVRVGSISDVDILVTDKQPDGEILRLFVESGAEIIC